MQAARQNLGQAVAAIHLVSIDPVQNVKESIHSQGSHVVRSYILNDPNLVEHDNLRDKGKCLEPQAQTPLKLEPPLEVGEWRVVLGLVSCVADQGQNERSWNQGFEVREVVAQSIIRLSVLN